jgi:hypothetical protein
MKVKTAAGTEFQVDECDLELVLSFDWNLDDLGYIREARPSGKRLHQLIMGKAPDGLTVDHINRDRLDNRRSNLRWASWTGQMINRGVRKDSGSGVTGVRALPAGRWEAYINVGKRKIHLGAFPEKALAIAARKAAELKYHQPILEKNYVA